jgi:glycosyltransferase involved in cell wall biosynthesis
MVANPAGMTSQVPRTLGLLNNFALDQNATPTGPRHRRPSSAFFCGAGVASAGAVRALLEFGTLDRYELFALPHRVRAVSASIESLVRNSHSKVIDVHDCRRLLANGTNRFSIWYDAHASYFATTAYVRDTFSHKPYPITGTIHTISYQSQLHETIFPMLLANAYPFDSIVCTSRAARSAFAALLEHVSEHICRAHGLSLRWPGRLDVIPLGVDTELFRPRDKVELRHKLGLPASACILLYVGRLSAVDKTDLLPLLTIVKKIVSNPRNTSVLLLVAGSDYRGYGAALKQAIRALDLGANARVIASPASTTDLYSAADVFVSPSDSVQESFGITNLEAMASGLPQVVSDWDGYRDTVRHRETGFRVPTYWAHCDGDLSALGPLAERTLEFDHASLAQSVAVDLGQFQEYLEALVRNDVLRRDMGDKAREVAVKEYSWRAITQQYESLWAELTLEAASATQNPRRVSGQVPPTYINAFGHYATSILPDATGLRLTNAGRASRCEKRILPEYTPAAQLNLLCEHILRDLLCQFRESPRRTANEMSDSSACTVSLGELSAAAAAKHGEHPDYVRRHVMWLLKYGLIEGVTVDSS